MNKKSLLIICIAILAVIAVVLAFFFFRQQAVMQEMVEQMEFEKEELQEEYEDLAIQFDGYQNMEIRNDSLQELLGKEQQRVHELLEELRITKVTSAKRIAELKKELATVRKVMVTYVHQIDSLNRTNERLVAENQQYRQQYKQVSREAERLEQEKTELTEVVSRASMLEVTAFEVTTLNKRDRKTRLVGQIAKLQIDFTLGKNITCEPGLKTVYLRLVAPNGDLMTKDTSKVFAFEDSEIGYSLSREIEYAGEAVSSVMYWSFAAEPAQGIYNADLFVDGNLIGSFPFEIRK